MPPASSCRRCAASGGTDKQADQRVLTAVAHPIAKYYDPGTLDLYALDPRAAVPDTPRWRGLPIRPDRSELPEERAAAEAVAEQRPELAAVLRPAN